MKHEAACVSRIRRRNSRDSTFTSGSQQAGNTASLWNYTNYNALHDKEEEEEEGEEEAV